VSNFKGLEAPCVFERINDRWEVGVGISDGSFQQVSYVNSICTIKGGQHVNYIVDQLTNRLIGAVKKKNKGQEVKAGHIKNHLAVYVNALVVNPAFDSQTKENLTTKSSNFGSTAVLQDKFLKKVEKSGVIDNILSWAKFKQNAELKKKGGSKKSKLVGITKLDDANFAGSAKSKDCTLILTEGDSAKALAICGLGVIGRDYYGVFPLKGKLLNVREAPHAQILKNEEIQNVAKILGLTFGKVYTDVSSLRYGHLMIMTDQDHDGSHIKGLLINFLHHFWPSLLELDGFLQQFITPIVKCSKGKKEETFFTIPEYLTWKTEMDEAKGWKTKYYKGLGTSTAAEAKEYFSHLATHEINFAWSEGSGDCIELAFAKKRVDDRKRWLLAMEPDTFMDYAVDSVTYPEFVNKELILFSHADNQRSIPHFLDGFKPSQRKVLFACFKRNLKQEIKVAQLAGYISEHSAYHHGEASLTQTIIGMAQQFVGSGNLNLLVPCGQFGTRLMGGKDAASPRYVFTKLQAITRCIFHPDDDPLLTYLDDDGQSIEPVSYVPVIPMVLVNGSEGIGTGWSSSVPIYNPRELMQCIRLMLSGVENCDLPTLRPWYRGFNGQVRDKSGKDAGNFTISGIIEISEEEDNTLIISELPVGKSTTDYKQFLETMVVGYNGGDDKKAGSSASDSGVASIKDFRENHTDTSVLFTLSMVPEKLEQILREPGGLAKKFKMDGSTATSNMHLFDNEGHIHKYEKVQEIMDDFYDVRLEYYEKRKNHLSLKLSDDWEKLENKMRFILAVIHGELVVSNRKKSDILSELQTEGYKMFFPVKKNSSTTKEDDAEEEEAEDTVSNNTVRGYDYLLSMKLWSLTQEKVEALGAERDAKREQLDELMAKTPEDLWHEDLDALEIAMDVFDADIASALEEETAARNKATKARGGRGGKGTAKGKKAPASKKKVVKKKVDYDSDEMSEDEFDEDDEDSDFEEIVPQAKQRGGASKLAVTKAKVTKQTTLTAARGTPAPALTATAAPLKVAVTKKRAPATKKAEAVQKVTEVKDAAPAAPLTLAERLMLRMKQNTAAPAAKSTSVFDFPSDCYSTQSQAEPMDLTATDPPSPPAKKQTKKRATKTSKPAAVNTLDDFVVYSPGVSTPKDTKKARKATAAAASASDDHLLALTQSPEVHSPPAKQKAPVKKTAAKKPTVVKKAPAPKKAAAAAVPKKAAAAPKKKTIVIDSEEESDFSEAEEVVEVVKKAAAPRRQAAKKAVTYVYSDEESEEEEESDFEEDEDEEEEDESDYEGE
jgi:DNA topoisomerase II